ncbi:RNA-binding S4 domain-containing protein [Mongoliimonas terrestris]|uniref:RNA-binding S4 domain-containing protein n=1 Tax=Mongoliimonas terrestris TaxID=1709001 RepID=UPI000AF998E9|nr:RNA-binding S4 domain-containing protein [Mongoliimonas terrestris]
MADDRQRIDKWLWFARMAKTRPVAQTLAESGHVRVNGRKIDASAHPVRIGDVLTIGLRGEVRVLKVLSFAARRGAYPEARLLYKDLAPRPDATPAGDAPDLESDDDGGPAGSPSPVAPIAAGGEKPRPVRGEGRPTKRDRRRFDRFDPDGSS